MTTRNQYVFTEPYTPERGEFHPVHVSETLEFADVSTGPPWSSTVLEIAKRRDGENRIIAPRKSIVTVPPCRPEKQIAITPQIKISDHDEFSKTFLSMMDPQPGVLEYAQTFTEITLSSGVTVPLPYIRAKIPSCYRHLFLDDESATHTLRITDIQHTFLDIPVHDIVLVAQCLRINELLTLQPNHRKMGNVKPLFVVNDVPQLDSFWVLLQWLYSNDEDELYETLEISGHENLCGFMENCRFWGVIDVRVAAVVRELVESRS
jgi:hypothetical protein